MKVVAAEEDAAKAAAAEAQEDAAEAEAQQRQVQRLLPATVEARVQPHPPLRLAVAVEAAAAEAAEAPRR